MRTPARRFLPLFLLCAFLAAAHGQERDVQALVDELTLPKIGSFTFSMEFTSAMLSDEPSPEELAEEEAAIHGRAEGGTASAADYARLAQVLSELERAEESKAARARARELYEAALQADPDDVASLVGLGGLMVGDLQGERAEELLTRAVELDPERTEAYTYLVHSLAWRANPFSVWLGKLKEQFPEQFENLDGLDAATGAEGLAGLQRMMAFLQRVPALMQAFEELQKRPLTQEQVAAQSDAAERAVAWAEAARPYMTARVEREGSREAFEEFVSIEITAALAPMMSALASAATGGEGPGPDEATQYVLQLLGQPHILEAGQLVCGRNPEDLKLRLGLGSLQAMRLLSEIIVAMAGEGDEMALADPIRVAAATENLTAAMALPAEERPGAVAVLAMLHFINNEGQEAASLVAQAIDRGEWSWAAVSVAYLSKVGLTLGDVVGGGGDLDITGKPGMWHDLETWIEKAQPQEPAPWASLAGARAKADDWPGALEALDRALEYEPESRRYTTARGILLLKLGRNEDAVEALGKAVAVEPGDDDPEDLEEDAHYAYGVALLTVGRAEEAEEELDWEPEE